jgi:hypothetical protein
MPSLNILFWGLNVDPKILFLIFLMNVEMEECLKRISCRTLNLYQKLTAPREFP